MKTAIYARFSSTLQDARSVDDQVRICRERAEREGWQVVEVFADYAISGAVRDRPGLNGLLARAGEFDIVLAEAIDRISRHTGDIHSIYETLKFNDCQIVTLSEGQIGEMHIGFSGTMASMFRTNLADKIRRGQSGRIAAGRIPGGICYGYRKIVRLDAKGEPERGLREIDPDQAAVISRIVDEFLAGQSALSIVRGLNADGIPGPRGGQWTVSMVNGDAVRGNGILWNEIYAGWLVYGRTKMVRDPVSRRRVPRVNPQDQWQRQAVPELRIIDDRRWQAVKDRQRANHGWTFNRLKRPKRLLSGLVQCGCCGANYVIVSQSLWACSASRSKGNCSNSRKITTTALEARVLGGLQQFLRDPDLVSAAIRRAHEINTAEAKERAKAKGRLDAKLAKVRAKVDRLVTAYANGGREFEELREVLATAKTERAALERELAEIGADNVIQFLPNLAEHYHRAVDRLTDALNGSPEGRAAGIPALRSLIDGIRCYPKPDGRGVDIELTGRLANIIAISTGKPLEYEDAPQPTFQVVAEDRYALKSRIARIVV